MIHKSGYATFTKFHKCTDKAKKLYWGDRDQKSRLEYKETQDDYKLEDRFL